MKCTRLGCEAEATWRITPAQRGNQDWFGCDEHQPGMTKSLSMGSEASTTAEAVRLDAPKPIPRRRR